jgi:hypothetical protein
VTGSPEYGTAAVDWFLDQLRRQEDRELAADPWRDLPVANYFTRTGPGGLGDRTATPARQAHQEPADPDREYLAQDCAAAWRNFSLQPGPQLRLARAGIVRRDLRTAERQTVASLRDLLPSAIRAGGRTFTLKQVTGSSWPDIAEIVRRSHGDYPRGHFLPEEAPYPAADTQRGRKRQAKASRKHPRIAAREHSSWGELLDEAGMPVLYVSGRNFSHSAGALYHVPDERWLRFPVRGTTRANAIMTAVDQAGAKVARYRIIGKPWTITQDTMEITVHPGQLLTDELAIAIAMSTPWLSSYLEVSG